MYAITVSPPGAPDNLDWTQVMSPKPGPGEVLVRTVAVGVNRADVLQRQGHYPPPAGESEIIGLEASGIVEAVGPGVSQWKPGDPVVALLAGGGYAEQFIAPEGQLVAPPAGIDLVSAAGIIEVAATVVSNFDHVNLSSNQTVLIHGGAGGVGSFAIQYAKQVFNATVLTTAGTAEKLDYCRSLGADYAIDYHDDWADAVNVATHDHGADVILDIIGAAYLESNVNALAVGGRLVIIGMQKGSKGTLNIGRLLNKRGTVTATSLRFRSREQKAEICTQVAEQVWPLLTSGAITPAPETRIPLKEAAQAHKLLESGDNIGKILLVA